jgi:putative membrane protein
MMYGYGPAGWWMVLMPLLWTAIIAAAVWAVVRLTRPPTRIAGSGMMTARQILERRYAAGEIDETTYATMLKRISDSPPRE